MAKTDAITEIKTNGQFEYRCIDSGTGIELVRFLDSSAAELDIPRDTIALCLGHSWADVTAVYINYNERKKIDEAVKKVVEYVNGN